MSRLSATLIGWALIAAVGATCFALNALRFQHLHFNLFVCFTIVAGVALVFAVWWLEQKTRGGTPKPNREKPLAE